MNSLICIFVVTVLSLANARPQFVYNYGAIPASYHAVPTIGGVQYAASPLTYATPLTYSATPVKNVEPFQFVQYSSPIVKSTDESSVSHYVSPSFSPLIKGNEVGHVIQYSAPIVPVAPNLHHKFHTQAADGSYSFGYSGGPSSRHEIRDQFGIVHGAYNYIDPSGKVQSSQYVADGLGFRVAATNLPVGPVETPEVKAARAAHEAIKNKV